MEKVEMSVGLKAEDLRGITMRTHRHCQSYRVRIRMKGGQYFDRSLKSKTLAKKWKRDMESAIEHDRYEFTNPATKHTLAELIDHGRGRKLSHLCGCVCRCLSRAYLWF